MNYLSKYNIKNLGFTLIELLVVVAIIAILASISILAINPTKQTNKASDVKKKENLSQMRHLGVLYLDNNNNLYSNFCSNDQNAVSLIQDTNAVCYDSNNAWAAETILTGVNNELRYCVDSTGYAGNTTSPLGINDTSCNY